jgi:myo-inositol-1(or 4)-monophosphatase
LFATWERDAFAQLEEKAKLTRYGGDCYIYAMLAMGQVDIATDSAMNPHDIQALMPIIQGAGGVVTTADGGDASMGGFVIAAGSAQLHSEVLSVVRGIAES